MTLQQPSWKQNNLKKKLLLFGAGFYGRNAWAKLHDKYELIGFVDNNPSLSGTYLCGISVISYRELPDYYTDETDIILCTREYGAISHQLMQLGITSYYVMLEGLLYHSGPQETMMPVELNDYEYYRKKGPEKNILYIQNAACIRTHKIARIMKDAGYRVFLLYTLAPPNDANRQWADTYDQIWGFSSINGIVDFIGNSEFDLLHCSNEPDLLANIARVTDKPVVFDTHDMQSIRSHVSVEILALEYLANQYADGNLYTSSGAAEIARKKYGLADREVYVLENRILDPVDIGTPQRKLSEADQEIHCVYEGGIVGGNKNHHRYFENIWKEIASRGIHIHFYSQSDPAYCRQLEEQSPYLHYEGNKGSEELVREMTRYDCGLAVFHVTGQNRMFLETGTANKVYEYLNARLPVIVGDIQSYVDFVEQYQVGIRLDLAGDIAGQIKEACQIKIADDFLQKHGLTMRSSQKELERFYEKVKRNRSRGK